LAPDQADDQRHQHGERQQAAPQAQFAHFRLLRRDRGYHQGPQPFFDLFVRRRDDRAFTAIALDGAGMPDGAFLLRFGVGGLCFLSHGPILPEIPPMANLTTSRLA
jgi:hypothetical protein